MDDTSIENEETTTLLNNDPENAVQNSATFVKGTSWHASVFLVVNAALGVGLLNFSAAYDRSGGILVAVTIQTVCLVLIAGSMIILAYCSDIHRSTTYQDVVYSMCGKHMKTVCTIGIIVYIFGVSIVKFIVIGDQWEIFWTFIYGEEFCRSWYFNRKFITSGTSIILILPLCFSKRIDFLKYASAGGVLAMVYCVFLVVVRYFKDELHPGAIKTRHTSTFDLFKVIPVICFAYQCHLSLVPVYSCFQERKLSEITKTILSALMICALAYTVTASIGYLTFGASVNEDILLSYKPTTDVLIGVILVAAKMYTVYPIALFVGRSAIESMLTNGIQDSTDLRRANIRRIVITIFWFSSSLVLALFLPNIGIVISALGGLASVFVFIIPGLCLLQVVNEGYVNFQDSPKKYRVFLVVAVVYIVVGTFIFGETTTQTLWNDIKYGSNGIST